MELEGCLWDKLVIFDFAETYEQIPKQTPLAGAQLVLHLLGASISLVTA